MSSFKNGYNTPGLNFTANSCVPGACIMVIASVKLPHSLSHVVSLIPSFLSTFKVWLLSVRLTDATMFILGSAIIENGVIELLSVLISKKYSTIFLSSKHGYITLTCSFISLSYMTLDFSLFVS